MSGNNHREHRGHREHREEKEKKKMPSRSLTLTSPAFLCALCVLCALCDNHENQRADHHRLNRTTLDLAPIAEGVTLPATVLMNTGGIAATNCFLVADEEAKVAVLFDAPDHTTAPLLDEAQKRGWELIGLWLTHGHFDHVADHPEVAQRFPNAKVLIHRLDEPKLLRPNSSFFALPFAITPRRP